MRCIIPPKVSPSQRWHVVQPRMEISVLTDISVIGFYGYIGYIIDISMDIFT